MNFNPLVSVVMSIYNGEKYINDSIDSILNQTYRNFEFVIIDDGSTDKSLEILRSYKDSRISYISRENKGLIESLNEGIKRAKGKYIARMDADDISLPDRLKEQVELMESDDNIGISGTGVIGFGEGRKEDIWILAKDDKRIKTELLFSSSFAHPTVIMRRDLILKHNLFYDKNFLHAEDFELWTRFAQYIKMANIQKPLLKYRILDKSITREADRDVIRRYEIIKAIFVKYLQRLDINNSEKENMLHFNLTVNTRMMDNDLDFMNLKKYFLKITKANEKKNIFDEIELKKVLGKKWLWNIVYKKDIKAIFSKYFLYGIWGMITK